MANQSPQESSGESIDVMIFRLYTESMTSIMSEAMQTFRELARHDGVVERERIRAAIPGPAPELDKSWATARQELV
ncbi:hypothetical protein ACMATS_05885 [Streptoverticillium reticulum]|uniref:hypothetical protein n=1 Tax=Streptoverticillium reticulum TaxID=1433415 RepID=UPI0039BF44E6